jgi:hypothetical protein
VTASQPRNPPNAGLCDDCAHGRRIESERGSVFLLCELALTDSRFPKYPRLPVLACDGYKKKAGSQE